MKRLTAALMALTLLITLFGCAKQPEEKDAVDIFIEEQLDPAETFVAFDKDVHEMEDPLTICMDLEYVREPLVMETEVILNDFLYTLEESGGLLDVEILYIPKQNEGHGEARSAVLEQIREEIQAGGGPDVFIMNCYGPTEGGVGGIFEAEPLFLLPEQAMENGVFLPLDEYMAENTRFTEWDKQTQAVLAAGRNREGQQIIPLSYTLPVICFRKSDVDMDLTGKAYTWEDMLNDPEISEYTRLLADCATPVWDEGLHFMMDGSSYLEYILGPLADFEAGELNFTEEELQQRVKDIQTLYDELKQNSEYFEVGTKGALDYFCTWLGWQMVDGRSDVEDNIPHNDPLTMIPLYSDDGGATASILSWAAVNRNTDRPEDAYTVIDILMREYTQRNYWLYEGFLCGSFLGIPMHEDILHPDKPFGRGLQWSLTEENYNELCEVRSQITGANFSSKFGIELYKIPLYGTEEGEFAIYGYEEPFETVEEAVHSVYVRMESLLYG